MEPLYRQVQQPSSNYYPPYFQFPFLSPFPTDRVEDRLERLERQYTVIEAQVDRNTAAILDLERRVRFLEQRLGVRLGHY